MAPASAARTKQKHDRLAASSLSRTRQRPGGSSLSEGTSPPLAASLPLDVLLAIFQLLDHDTLFHALQVCRGWKSVDTDDLWQAICAARGWAADAPAPQQPEQQAQRAAAPEPQAQPSSLQHSGQRRQQQAAGQQRTGQQPQAETGNSVAGAWSWRQRYRRGYQAGCYECFSRCSRTTPRCGPLVLRLCDACARSHESPQPQHRLVAEAQARQRYCLKKQELEGLPYAVEANPVNPSFNSMHLYRVADVRRVSVARWGSWAAVEKERRRRLTRG